MFDITAPCPLAPALAERMREDREELTRRWLDRISARVELEPMRVFPTEELLNHVPLLIDGIAAYLENPAMVISADAPVVAKAMELGALRHRQGFDEYELLKEFEIFGGIVFAFLARTVQTMDVPCEKDELLVCGHRVFRAVAIIQEAALTHYMQRVRAKLAEREDRLRGFNRALTHELKNQLGAAMGAADLLDLEGLPAGEHARLLDVVRRNVRTMRGVLDNLVELSRLDSDTRQQRRVLLPKAVGEAVRQLRDAAQAARVRIELGELPPVEVSAAAVELAVMNFVSNAIKYADPARDDRWVTVRGATLETGTGPETVVSVSDNGIGVPVEKRARLFERGFRAHIDSVTGVEGDGLGLSIVKDALDAIGGRVWAEFGPEGGASFSFALPARRAGERAGGE